MPVVLTKPITKAQMRVLIVIGNYTQMNGFAPSYYDIMNELGLASTNAVRKHLANLQAGHFITHQTGKSRSIQLTPLAKDLLQKLGAS